MIGAGPFGTNVALNAGAEDADDKLGGNELVPSAFAETEGRATSKRGPTEIAVASPKVASTPTDAIRIAHDHRPPSHHVPDHRLLVSCSRAAPIDLQGFVRSNKLARMLAPP